MSSSRDAGRQLLAFLADHGQAHRVVNGAGDAGDDGPGTIDIVVRHADVSLVMRLASQFCRSRGGWLVSVARPEPTAHHCTCAWPDGPGGRLVTVRLDVHEPPFRGRWHRMYRRAAHPMGLTVAFLGIDGSGKSTVIGRVMSALAPVFARTQYFHFKPQAIIGATEPAGGGMIHPPGKANGISLLSLARLGYYLLDYCVGYVTKVWPLRFRGTLVVFDRYFYDLSIDPVRLHFRWPMALAARLDRWVPRPDVLIVLDVPAEVARSRKPQVPLLEEAARQRQEYLTLARHVPNAHVVDATRPDNDVFRAVQRIILDAAAERTAARHGLAATTPVSFQQAG